MFLMRPTRFFLPLVLAGAPPVITAAFPARYKTLRAFLKQKSLPISASEQDPLWDGPIYKQIKGQIQLPLKGKGSLPGMTH